MATEDPARSTQIKFRCPHCGKKLGARPALVGHQLPCPKCGQPVQVPCQSERDSVAAPGSANGPLTRATPQPHGRLASQCPHCGETLEADGSLAGQHVICPFCAGELIIVSKSEALHINLDRDNWQLPMSTGVKGMVAVLLGAITPLIGPFIPEYKYIVGTASFLLLAVGGIISLVGAFQRRGREAGIIGTGFAVLFLGIAIVLALLRSH